VLNFFPYVTFVLLLQTCFFHVEISWHDMTWNCSVWSCRFSLCRWRFSVFTSLLYWLFKQVSYKCKWYWYMLLIVIYF
jgi:hypothetical protein